MDDFPKTEKPRLVTDFTLDHTGGWGRDLSRIMIMIENFRIIKGLT